MSDEQPRSLAFVDDDADACAPTERDPTTAPLGAIGAPARVPERGVALSVLWWMEETTEDTATHEG